MFVLGNHKSDLGDNLNHFSCRKQKSNFPKYSTREAIGISFWAILRYYLQQCFLKVEDVFLDYLSSSNCRMSIPGTIN